MNKFIYWLLKGVCYLEISTLTIIAVLVTIDAVIARPICYFIDANGRTVNLSFICAKPSTSTKPPSQNQRTTPPPPNNPTPKNTPAEPAKNDSQNNNQSPENDQGDTTKQGEVDNSQSDSTQKKIPLLNE